MIFKNPVGHNKIVSTVKKLCAEVGVEGYKTNHSLRRTAATRLFQAGYDEQLIMDVTRHRSTDGVMEYNEVCLDQRKALSDIIQNPRKKVKHDVEPQETKPDRVSAMQAIFRRPSASAAAYRALSGQGLAEQKFSFF